MVGTHEELPREFQVSERAATTTTTKERNSFGHLTFPLMSFILFFCKLLISLIFWTQNAQKKKERGWDERDEIKIL